LDPKLNLDHNYNHIQRPIVTDSMEALPLELREHITSLLLLGSPSAGTTARPLSYKLSRTAIYSLRLTSRRMNEGAQQAFIQIVEDIPTQCTEQSLQRLEALVALPNVGKHIIHLAFNTCKLYLVPPNVPSSDQMDAFGQRKDFERQGLEDLKSLRSSWIKKAFGKQLARILRKTPRLRNLTCRPDALRRLGEFGSGSVVRELGEKELVAGIPDPLEVCKPQPFLATQYLYFKVKNPTNTSQYFQRTLIIQSFASILETLHMLKPISIPVYRSVSVTSPQGSAKPLRLPALKHLTFSPTCQENSSFRVTCPNLVSLHIALDDHCHATDFGSADLPYILDPQQATLRELVVSANQYVVTASAVFGALISVLRRAAVLEKVTIRNMIVQMDIAYDIPYLPHDALIREFVFENVKVSFTDEITLSGPSKPVDLGAGWRPIPRLCERAGVVRLRKRGEEERVLERREWDKGTWKTL
jgi:hypothetical protein